MEIKLLKIDLEGYKKDIKLHCEKEQNREMTKEMKELKELKELKEHIYINHAKNARI